MEIEMFKRTSDLFSSIIKITTNHLVSLVNVSLPVVLSCYCVRWNCPFYNLNNLSRHRNVVRYKFSALCPCVMKKWRKIIIGNYTHECFYLKKKEREKKLRRMLIGHTHNVCWQITIERRDDDYWKISKTRNLEAMVKKRWVVKKRVENMKILHHAHKNTQVYTRKNTHEHTHTHEHNCTKADLERHTSVEIAIEASWKTNKGDWKTRSNRITTKTTMLLITREWRNGKSGKMARSWVSEWVSFGRW